LAIIHRITCLYAGTEVTIVTVAIIGSVCALIIILITGIIGAAYPVVTVGIRAILTDAPNTGFNPGAKLPIIAYIVIDTWLTSLVDEQTSGNYISILNGCPEGNQVTNV
jgi:hypothetical protein